jgi:hypothetical protein
MAGRWHRGNGKRGMREEDAQDRLLWGEDWEGGRQPYKPIYIYIYIYNYRKNQFIAAVATVYMLRILYAKIVCINLNAISSLIYGTIICFTRISADVRSATREDNLYFLAVFLYILSTRVGEISARALNTLSFSLTLNASYRLRLGASS